MGYSKGMDNLSLSHSKPSVSHYLNHIDLKTKTKSQKSKKIK